MWQKLPANYFNWIEVTSQFNEGFIKDSISKNYMNFIMTYHFHLGGWRLKKLVASLHDKTECIIHIRNLKQVLNNRLVLKKVHRVIKFNQNVWLKPYISRNANLGKKAINDFEKVFF